MIKLPSTPDVVLREVLVPAFAMLPTKMDSSEARVQVLAIMMQESDLARRHQLGSGPARGLAQFELSGVTDVLTRTPTAAIAKAFCVQRGIALPVSPEVVLAALEFDDVLAVGIARLRLYLDAAQLPALGAADLAWRYYLRNWKPGRPRPEDWPNNYARALSCACNKPAGVASGS